MRPGPVGRGRESYGPFGLVEMHVTWRERSLSWGPTLQTLYRSLGFDARSLPCFTKRLELAASHPVGEDLVTSIDHRSNDKSFTGVVVL